MNPKDPLESFCDHPLIKRARERLREGLSSRFCYHTAAHTDEVLREVITLAREDKLSESAIELLAIAAAYHDTGFLVEYKHNEAHGAEMAKHAMLDRQGYDADQISAVQTMIMDTRLQYLGQGAKQVPTTELSRYLCDADVSNLGRVDFFEKSELYRKELGRDAQEFYTDFTLPFLESHEWYTSAARRLRDEQKQKNLAELRRRVGRV